MNARLTRRIAVVGGILGGQAILTRVLTKNDPPVPMLDIAKLDTNIAGWQPGPERQESEVALAALQPASYIHRAFHSASGRSLTLFAAYFRSMDVGPGVAGVHSPKVCLPGAGWLAIHENEQVLPVQGGAVLHLNRYELEKGRERILVLYWYQNRRRTWASEFTAKLHLVPDFLTGGGPEVALVRIVTPWTLHEPGEQEALSVFATDVHSRLSKIFVEAPLG